MNNPQGNAQADSGPHERAALRWLNYTQTTTCRRVPEGMNLSVFRVREQERIRSDFTKLGARVLDMKRCGKTTWWLLQYRVSPTRESDPFILETTWWSERSPEQNLNHEHRTEQRGPAATSCPEEFLARAPVVNSDWREQVHRYWESRRHSESTKRLLRATLIEGDEIRLKAHHPRLGAGPVEFVDYVGGRKPVRVRGGQDCFADLAVDDIEMTYLYSTGQQARSEVQQALREWAQELRANRRAGSVAATL